MRKSAFIIAFLWIITKGVGQPVVSTPSFPPSVNLFDLFEVSFTLGNSYANPYDPETIEIRAVFVSPDGTQYPVDAFYFEDYAFQKAFYGNDYYEKVSDSLGDVGWRIRFTPNCVGKWKFNICAKDANGTTQLPYRIRWYNSETGLPYSSMNPTIQNLFVSQDASGNKYLSFSFPGFIRDIKKDIVNNTFGDAVFVIRKYETQKPEKTE